MDTELWCLHIEGPDDIHAAPSKEAAQKRADELNAHWDRRNAAQPSENWPVMKAVVILCPWSAETHAEDLLNWNAP